MKTVPLTSYNRDGRPRRPTELDAPGWPKIIGLIAGEPHGIEVGDVIEVVGYPGLEVVALCHDGWGLKVAPYSGQVATNGNAPKPIRAKAANAAASCVRPS